MLAHPGLRSLTQLNFRKLLQLQVMGERSVLPEAGRKAPVQEPVDRRGLKESKYHAVSKICIDRTAGYYGYEPSAVKARRKRGPCPQSDEKH